MFRRCLLAFALVAACSGSPGRDPRYPRRRPGCELSVYNGLPTSGSWNDIGVAEVGCYIDESEIACLGRLRTEACRMGGDIIYNVPKKAARPIERGMIYRARVAHTVDVKKKEEDAPAPADAGNGQVVPLPKATEVAAKPVPADGGAPPDAARQ
jgi:hypothetical protein